MNSEELKSLPVFAGLSTGQLQRPAELLKPVAFPAGAVIFAAGDRASHLFVIQSGEVIIRFHPYDGGALDIATIQAGDAFGWSAVLRRSYYTSSAICRTDVMVFTIPAHDLQQIMSNDPQFSDALLERAAQSANNRFDSLGRQVIQLIKPKSQ